jgi:hypothetical protein
VDRTEKASAALVEIAHGAFRHIQAGDAGEPGTPARRLEHGVDGVGRTGNHRFHKTFALIPHPTFEAMPGRFVRSPGAIADALHAASHDEMPNHAWLAPHATAPIPKHGPTHPRHAPQLGGIALAWFVRSMVCPSR